LTAQQEKRCGENAQKSIPPAIPKPVIRDEFGLKLLVKDKRALIAFPEDATAIRRH
jgi:hypothetical protein